MQRIGVTLLIVGLMGVPVLAATGAGISFSACLALFGMMASLLVCLAVYRRRGLGRWLSEPLDVEFTVNPVLLMGVGVFFVLAGLGIMVFGKPAAGPKGMTQEQLTFFGFLFLLMGLGACVLSGAHRRTRRKAKQHPPPHDGATPPVQDADGAGEGGRR